MKYIKSFVVVIVSSLLVACGNQSISPESTSNMRESMIRDAVFAYSAKLGLHWKGLQINSLLDTQEKYMGQVFNFTSLLMKRNLLPPIVQETRNTLHLSDDNTIRLSDRYIEILSPARFVTAPPDWRQYLYVSYPMPEMLNKSIWPKNRKERAMWDESMLLGWNDGTMQAVSIFFNQLAIISRDFKGMILYRRLLAQGMITQAYTATTDLGITGDKQHMYINDKFVRVTSEAELLTKQSQSWHPALSSQASEQLNSR